MGGIIEEPFTQCINVEKNRARMIKAKPTTIAAEEVESFRFLDLQGED